MAESYGNRSPSNHLPIGPGLSNYSPQVERGQANAQISANSKQSRKIKRIPGHFQGVSKVFFELLQHENSD
jgi:hypothetical protein